MLYILEIQLQHSIDISCALKIPRKIRSKNRHGILHNLHLPPCAPIQRKIVELLAIPTHKINKISRYLIYLYQSLTDSF